MDFSAGKKNINQLFPLAAAKAWQVTVRYCNRNYIISACVLDTDVHTKGIEP